MSSPNFLNRLCSATRELMAGERGATAVEYGLFVALVAAVIILIVTSVGEKVKNGFNLLNTSWT